MAGGADIAAVQHAAAYLIKGAEPAERRPDQVNLLVNAAPICDAQCQLLLEQTRLAFDLQSCDVR